MSVTGTIGAPPAVQVIDDECRSMLAALIRSDQRRWAEMYVHGLLTVTGHRSVRRIAAAFPDPTTAQSLQQFVNQSRWATAPLRRSLRDAVGRTADVRAWVVREVSFPKDGRCSVGVARQYAPDVRRVANCQLALCTWLAGPALAVPVDWRLMLPREWDPDLDHSCLDRRTKAQIPDHERSRPGWVHVLDAVDELAGTGAALAPLVADRRHDPHVEPLLRGLEERGLHYAVRVTDRTPVVAERRSGPPRTAGDLARSAARGDVPLAPILDVAQGQELRGPGSLPISQTFLPGRAGRGPRRLMARWVNGWHQPAELWLDNVDGAAADLMGVLDALDSTDRSLARLRAESGLTHFEGRSHRGWHHHVTLASIAHAHRVLGHGPVVPSELGAPRRAAHRGASSRTAGGRCPG